MLLILLGCLYYFSICLHIFLNSNCSSISSLPDISNWEIKNNTNITGLFQKCSLLISLPDISQWSTNNFTNMSYLFFKCSSLSSLPDISK